MVIILSASLLFTSFASINLTVITMINIKIILADVLLLCTYPQKMARVEKLRPQIVEQVKPNEEEDVDAHPHHLPTHPGSFSDTQITFHFKTNSF